MAAAPSRALGQHDRADRRDQQRSQQAWKFLVELLDQFPAITQPPLIVIDRDEQRACDRHATCHPVERVPEFPRVMQHPPGVDQVELAQSLKIVDIESRALFDIPRRRLGPESVDELA